MPKLPYVLLVDDDPTTNFLNQKLLERLAVAEQMPWPPTAARPWTYCWRSATSSPLTGRCLLVFLDVNMPVMNGIQFLKAYQQQPPAQQCAVVVMLITSIHSKDVERVDQRPVAGFLPKPLTQQHIERVLQEHFA